MNFTYEQQEYTEEQKEIIEEYCGNNMQKLNEVIRLAIIKKNAPRMCWEDLKDIGIETFVRSIKTYDSNVKCSFKTFLIGNIYRRFYDWTRNNMRFVRCNLQTDEDGKIIIDEKTKLPIPIPNVSLEQKTENDVGWSEKVDSDFKIEEEISKEIGLSSDEDFSPEMQKYLKSLSPLQKKIVMKISEGCDKEEICKDLNITVSHYDNSLKRIMSNEKTKPLEPLVERMNRYALKNR